MSSDLSILAGRIRDFIAICADEFSSEHQRDPDFVKHADAEFNGFALMLFTLQFQHNAAYRKFCEARKILPSKLAHWSEIPAMPASAFKELELTSLLPEKRTHVFYSSGTTTRRPGRHFHNAESLALYTASALTWFRFHIPREKHLAILTPPPAQAPNSSLVQMFEMVRTEFDAPAESFLGKIAADQSWTVDLDAALRFLDEAARKNEGLLLLGTAFSFVHLLDHLAEKNLRFKLPAGSRAMETGGYKNRSRVLPKTELQALITDRLGIPAEQIHCEYGMSELSSQAYDRKVSSSKFQVPSSSSAGSASIQPPASSNFRFPPWARVQIISPETGREVGEGETGLLRVYDLANVFSVLAIQTEDLAVRRREGFELLGRAERAEPRGCSLMSHSALA